MIHSPSFLEIVSLILFVLAILHTFSTKYFEKLSLKYKNHSDLFHLLGEIEIVFGLWALVAILCLLAISGKIETIKYLNSRNYTEPLFVFVIMIISSTKPILNLSLNTIQKISQLIPIHSTISLYATTLFLTPFLGSIITEPAAMTLAALMLKNQFFENNISKNLKYATLGVLFVNVSIGGCLTNFAAPPVLMVASKWNWSSSFMWTQFGWKALLAVAVNSFFMTYFFRKELKKIIQKDFSLSKHKIPFSILGIHLFFLFLVIFFSHYPVIFIGIFLFFLGFTHAYSKYQSTLLLRESLLVAFFLAGIVTLGGFQQWWLSSILLNTNHKIIFYASLLLTTVTDNAAITYLASLVDGLDFRFKYALMSGALSGGGLTIIANAPNPAGIAILKNHFENNTVDPIRLFIAALLPTIVASVFFIFL